jgi:orotidine-5'-phosphate decarboxylase
MIGNKPLIVTPGIRPSGAATNDQKRVKTPGQAIAEGSNLLVVGRPIWGASSPRAVAEAIIEEIASAG